MRAIALFASGYTHTQRRQNTQTKAIPQATTQSNTLLTRNRSCVYLTQTSRDVYTNCKEPVRIPSHPSLPTNTEEAQKGRFTGLPPSREGGARTPASGIHTQQQRPSLNRNRKKQTLLLSEAEGGPRVVVTQRPARLGLTSRTTPSFPPLRM